MGKVYDALQRAEEQRARRLEEAASPGLTPPVAAPAPSAPAAPTAPRVPQLDAPAPLVQRPPLWKRLFTRRARLASDHAGDMNKRRIALLQPESYVTEQYRTLRARIDSIGAQRPIRTVAITSARDGEGKTTTAVNLALVTGMSLKRRVMLLDCDLRRPAVARTLGLRPEAGLVEVLTGKAELDDAILTVEGTGLEVLPIRGRASNPSELLSSSHMRELIEELQGRYDRVVLDLPPALGLPDAKSMSELCDGVVLVVRANETASQEVEASLDLLERNRLLGLVLNGIEAVDAPHYVYGA